MIRQKLALPITYLVVVLGFQMLAISSLSNSAWAQSTSKKSNATVRVTFEPPKGDRPKDSAGGASRDGGRCPQDPKNSEPYVTPLLPANHYGLTTESRPTFFVYLPPTSASKAFFSIRDENDGDHYQTFVSLTSKPGVMSIQLPADAPPLEVGKTYKWSFVVMCDNLLRPDSPLVEGQIQRVEMSADLSSQIAGATPLERAALYGKAGLWYETLTTIADIRRSQRDDAETTAIWENLLHSVELGAIATQPIVK